MRFKTQILAGIFLTALTGMLLLAPYGKASFVAPDQYSDSIDYKTKELQYEILATNGNFTWTNIDWAAPSRGIPTPAVGGRIIVNFTGFFAPHPSDWSKPSYYTTGALSIPYVGVGIPKKVGGSFVQNFTLANVSNTEASTALALGYSGCNTGFLSSTNWTHVEKIAKEAADKTGWTPADFTLTDADGKITLKFVQDGGAQQNTTLVYQKSTGILLSANTELKIDNYFGLQLRLMDDQDIPGFTGFLFVALAGVFVSLALRIRKMR